MLVRFVAFNLGINHKFNKKKGLREEERKLKSLVFSMKRVDSYFLNCWIKHTRK